VLQGPGCLNYSLILRIEGSPVLHSIPATNEFILKCHIQALADALQTPVTLQGQTDLTIGGLKFSGNAQRRKKHFLIFHGTFLLNFDLSLIEKALPLPSRRPSYRANRSHADFLTNLCTSPDVIKAALLKIWDAYEPFQENPINRIARLAREKYALEGWNLKF
jgi:lipoate---protein ligase